MVSNGPKVIYGVDGKPLISADGKPMVGGLAEQTEAEDQSISVNFGQVAALDIDVDEVGDRIDLLKDTVNEIGRDDIPIELLKIVSIINSINLFVLITLLI